MKEYVIPSRIAKRTPEYYERARFLSSLKKCPYCNQPIKKPVKI